MKHLKPVILSLIVLTATFYNTYAQSPVGKSLHEVIGLWGDNFKRLTDAEGMHVLQYKRGIAKDTVADFLYLQGFTCVKQESLRPVDKKSLYVDSLNQKYTSAGPNAWLSKDSTYIT